MDIQGREVADCARYDQHQAITDELRREVAALEGKVRFFGRSLDASLNAEIATHDRLNTVVAQQAKLLFRCQETLNPHRDAVLWGDVCAALAPASACSGHHRQTLCKSAANG